MGGKDIEPHELREIIQSGDFTKFIGKIENNWLDFKEKLYYLAKDTGKLELCKDICAFANCDGGFIIIGIVTDKVASHLYEEVTKLSLVKANIIDIEQYHNIIDAWVYPKIKDISIKWFRSQSQADKGIITINIPEQNDINKPFLINKTILDYGKRRDIIFGYSERRRANAQPISIQELQSLIRDGLNYQNYLQNINDTLTILIESGTKRPEGIDIAKVNNRIKDALASANLADRPNFSLAIFPQYPITIVNIFGSPQESFVTIFENPPILRRAGFDMVNNKKSHIIKGERRQVNVPNRQIREIWRDGLLIFSSAVDRDFLCWGTEHGDKINPLALVESTYLFVKFFAKIQAHCNYPTTVNFVIEFQNVNNKFLVPGPLPSFGWRFDENIKPAPDNEWKKIISLDIKDMNVGKLSFDIVREIYHWFGFDVDDIPYVSRDNDSYFIDEKLIIEATA